MRFRPLRASSAAAMLAAAILASSCAREIVLPPPEKGAARLGRGEVAAWRWDPSAGSLVPLVAGGRSSPGDAAETWVAALSMPVRGADYSAVYAAVEGLGLARARIARDGGLVVASEAIREAAFEGRRVMGFLRSSGNSYCHLWAEGAAGADFAGRDIEGRALDPSFLRVDRAHGTGWQAFVSFDTIDGAFVQLRRESPDRIDYAFLSLSGAPPFTIRSLERERFQSAVSPRLLAVAPSFVREAVAALGVKGNVLVLARGDRGSEAWISESLDGYFETVHAFLDGNAAWLLRGDGTLSLPGGMIARLPLPLPGARYAELSVVNGVVMARWTVDDFPAIRDSGIVAMRTD